MPRDRPRQPLQLAIGPVQRQQSSKLSRQWLVLSVLDEVVGVNHGYHILLDLNRQVVLSGHPILSERANDKGGEEDERASRRGSGRM